MLTILLWLVLSAVACEYMPREIGGGVCWYEGEGFTHVLDADQKQIAVQPFRVQDEAGNVGYLCVVERSGTNPYDATGDDWYDAGGKFGYAFGFYTPQGQQIVAHSGARYFTLRWLETAWE